MTLSELTEAPTAASIFTDAHTAYLFTPEAVGDADLARIYELAKFTPTALNSQPLRITFVRTDAAKARLLPLLSESNRAKSASAPVVAKNAEGRTAMAMNNAWLQAGGFILAVRAAGFDAGPMGGINAPGIDAEFFAGTPLRTFMVVNIGHVAEDGAFPRNPRLGFDQAVTLA